MKPQLTILKCLRLVSPRLLRVETLWSDTLMCDDRVSYSEFKSALRELEEKEQVVVIKGEDRTSAKITDAGMARLAESGF